VRLTDYEIEEVKEKLFPRLIFLVLGVALLALRTISEEEGDVGLLLMEQAP